MITLQKTGASLNRDVLEIVGLSTDTKPLNSTGGIENQFISNGSKYFEMDTSTTYIFDYAGNTWISISGDGSGSGGGTLYWGSEQW